MRRGQPQTLAWLSISILILVACAAGLIAIAQASDEVLYFCGSMFAAAGFLIVAIIRSGKVIARSFRETGPVRVFGVIFGVAMLLVTTLLEIGVCGLLILMFAVRS